MCKASGCLIHVKNLCKGRVVPWDFNFMGVKGVEDISGFN